MTIEDNNAGEAVGEERFVDILVEVLHTLSARVTWPNEHNHRVFEGRLEELRSLGGGLEEADVLLEDRLHTLTKESGDPPPVVA